MTRFNFLKRAQHFDANSWKKQKEIIGRNKRKKRKKKFSLQL